MKQVYIFRHGKSDWDADFSTDHERPLAPRGIKAARAMGAWLARTGQAPEHIVSSTALRARTTMQLAAEAGAWAPTPVLTDRLYDATTSEYLATIRETPDSASSVLVAGHEPTCSGTVLALTDGGNLRFPTAAIARVDLNIRSWRDARPGLGELIWFMVPRVLLVDE